MASSCALLAKTVLLKQNTNKDNSKINNFYGQSCIKASTTGYFVIISKIITESLVTTKYLYS